MMNIMVVLLAKRAFSFVIEGVNSKIFRWLRSCDQDPLP